MKTILLKPTNKGIYINRTLYIPISQTNLPDGTFLFKTRHDYYWKCELLGYAKKSTALKLKVVEFNVTKIDTFPTQSPKTQISQLVFEPLNWEYLQHQLSSFKKKDFYPIIYNTKEGIKDESKPFSSYLKTRNKTYKINHSKSLKKGIFKLGYIEFKVKLKELSHPIKVPIYNDIIIPQFEHIKSFIEATLPSKKISLKGIIEEYPNGTFKYYVKSREIEQITEETISNIRILHTKNVLKSEIQKDFPEALFSFEELMDQSNNAELSNFFGLNDYELLTSILESKNIRNKKQIEYLSGKIHDRKEKLLFTLNPQFGFLFTYSGDKMHHYIWEMLDSYATYIWSFDKGSHNKKERENQIQEIISLIFRLGRSHYRSNSASFPVPFNIITHKKINSPFIDGFPLWRNALNEKLC